MYKTLDGIYYTHNYLKHIYIYIYIHPYIQVIYIYIYIHTDVQYKVCFIGAVTSRHQSSPVHVRSIASEACSCCASTPGSSAVYSDCPWSEIMNKLWSACCYPSCACPSVGSDMLHCYQISLYFWLPGCIFLKLTIDWIILQYIN